MKKIFRGAMIYDSDNKCFTCGDLVTDGALIVGAFPSGYGCDGDQCEIIDAKDLLIAPGLIDLHTHGRAGGDFNDVDSKLLSSMASSYLCRGVTSVMPSLASAPLPDLEWSIETIAAHVKAGNPIWIGIHLEGRYLNPAKRGAHAEELLAPLDSCELGRLLDKMSIVGKMHVSAALELDSDGSFSRSAKEKGATLGLAHTIANAEEARLAFERGAISLTHTFNAMPQLHHRDVGALGVGLTDPEIYCELIVDGFHVSPDAVKLAYLLKGDKLVLVTDSMQATGAPDGEYLLAGMTVTVKGGKAITSDGAIAGSTLDLMDGVKNLAAFASIPFAEALYCATASPAKMIGLYDRIGSIDKGKDADLILLDNDLNVRGVISKGERIF